MNGESFLRFLKNVMTLKSARRYMLATKKSVGVAPEVSLRKYVSCTPPPPSANKTQPALKPRVDVTRSPKQGHQWPHKKDLCPPIFFLKKEENNFWLVKGASLSTTDPFGVNGA